MHIHIGIIEAIRIFMYVIIMGFSWRIAASHFAQSDNPVIANVGKAMSFIY